MVHGELKAGWTEWLYWLLRRRQHFVVRGNSMRPTLSPGDHILLDPHAYCRGRPAVGDVVIAKHPFESERIIVKRVSAVDDDGRCFLTGDNPSESTDSHALSSIPGHLILGRVTRQIP